MTLHERIARAIGWSVADTQSFSLPALREMVRGTHPKLVHEIDRALKHGTHIVGEPWVPQGRNVPPR